MAKGNADTGRGIDIGYLQALVRYCGLVRQTLDPICSVLRHPVVTATFIDSQNPDPIGPGSAVRP